MQQVYTLPTQAFLNTATDDDSHAWGVLEVIHLPGLLLATHAARTAAPRYAVTAVTPARTCYASLDGCCEPWDAVHHLQLRTDQNRLDMKEDLSCTIHVRSHCQIRQVVELSQYAYSRE